MFCRHAQTQSGHLFLGLLQSDTRLKPRDAVEGVPPPGSQHAGGEGGWHPHVDIARWQEIEFARHHTDYFARRVVQDDLTAQDIACSSEAPLPESVANNRDGRGSHIFEI